MYSGRRYSILFRELSSKQILYQDAISCWLHLRSTCLITGGSLMHYRTQLLSPATWGMTRYSLNVGFVDLIDGDTRLIVQKLSKEHISRWNYLFCPSWCVKTSQDTTLDYLLLTHWGRDKMAAIFQTTFWNAFSWMKMLKLRLSFHWSLFPRVQLTIFHHWFR